MKKLGWAVLGALALVGSYAVYTQAQAPSDLPGCQYTTATPTLADKQTTVIRCDVNGKIIVQ